VGPPAFRFYFETGIKLLQRRFLRDLHRHLESPEFAASLRRAGDQHLNESPPKAAGRTAAGG